MSEIPTNEQLTLIEPVDLPLQFRLDRHTRQLGLARIAQIRAEMAARAAAREAANGGSANAA
ncbi:MAG: hypothetical protein RI900_3347 [Actinomycetota bacterium]|jgi:hypothetical protein